MSKKQQFLYLIFLIVPCFSSCVIQRVVSNEKIVKIKKVSLLDSTLGEVSGAIHFGRETIFLNDGSNGSFLHTLSNWEDTTRKIKIPKVENIDWEALTHDLDRLYIGEFGNNLGMRKDLRVISIPLQSLHEDSVVSPRIISFRYVDQTNFAKQKKHRFDCEAMIATDSTLLLFSKNRLTDSCTIYKLDKDTPIQIAHPIHTFYSYGQITDAYLDPITGSIRLIGYKFGRGSWISFIWYFPTFQHVLNSDGQLYILNKSRQFEAIWMQNNETYVAHESIPPQSSAIYRVILPKSLSIK